MVWMSPDDSQLVAWSSAQQWERGETLKRWGWVWNTQISECSPQKRLEGIRQFLEDVGLVLWKGCYQTACLTPELLLAFLPVSQYCSCRWDTSAKVHSRTKPMNAGTMLLGLQNSELNKLLLFIRYSPSGIFYYSNSKWWYFFRKKSV